MEGKEKGGKGRGKRERKRKKEISPPPLGPSSEKEKNRPPAAAAAHSSPKGEKLKLSSSFFPLPPRVWHRVEEGESWRKRERKVEEVPKIGSNSLLLRMGSCWLLASTVVRRFSKKI